MWGNMETKINNTALTNKDYSEFMEAKTFKQRMDVLQVHSQKNEQFKRRNNMEEMQENVKKENKVAKFFKDAFHDMAENAKAQHEVDKANFEAVKAESRATFEENRGKNTLKRARANAKKSWDDAHMKPAEIQAKVRDAQAKQIEEAYARTAAAKERVAKAKNN